jgi:hypothetical protein
MSADGRAGMAFFVSTEGKEGRIIGLLDLRRLDSEDLLWIFAALK